MKYPESDCGSRESAIRDFEGSREYTISECFILNKSESTSFTGRCSRSIVIMDVQSIYRNIRCSRPATTRITKTRDFESKNIAFC